MAIVRMKKLTLAAPQSDREEILDFIQEKGCVQIVDLKNAADDFEEVDCFRDTKNVNTAEINYNHIKFTNDFLNKYKTQKDSKFKKRDIISKEEFDCLEGKIKWEEIYNECREIEEKLNQNRNRKTKLLSQIDQYEIWKDLDLCSKDIENLRKSTVIIGTLPQKYEVQLYEELNSSVKDAYIEKISVKQQDVNILILCHINDVDNVSEVLKKYGFTKLNLDISQKPSEQVKDISQQIQKADEEFGLLDSRAHELSANLNDMQKVYDYAVSRLDREKAVFKLLKTQKTFILKSWIAEDEVEAFTEKLSKRFADVYIITEDTSDDDMPPVILKNNSFAEPFEAITSMYALPLPTEVDPTPILAIFFFVFFGMMMADIGYGIVLGAATLFMLKKMDLEGEGRKLVKLLCYCSIPTIIFGILYGSFFGGIVDIPAVWLNPVDKPMDVLIVSIAMGIVHLFVGLGVKAYSLIKAGKPMDAFMDVFSWYIMLSGLIWMLLGGQMGAKILAIAGALIILFTAGRSNESIIGKFFGGLYSLYGVTSYLGDALSYSRLLALGLASGLIGWSFNLLIGLLGDGVMKIIFGPIIFLAGHTFNFLIGALGTFVHTCRLQYLEFFGKFYEGGGKAFEPLKISSKFIRVNTER